MTTRFIDSSLEDIRRELAVFPRMVGYYLVNMVLLDPDWRDHEEAALDSAFQALDDQDWPPRALPETDGLWGDDHIDESVARDHIITALVGGRSVGHVHDTMSHTEATRIWDKFRALFPPESRFFYRLGFGDPKYVFQNGVIVVDEIKAGCLCVIESD